jgi:predicted nucleic acid-binding protein
MNQEGAKRIYTLDTHFRMFPFLEVVNPLNGK